MTSIYLITLTLLLTSLLIGALRVLRGPKLADRLLAAQLFGTTGVAVLLVLAELQQLNAARDTALILALLAMLATVAFVSRVWKASAPQEKSE
ncbi:monovalent cation/H+ antiporter complex subunit F [Nitrincola iocasae]|uniref:pH regulation protein F n=1 Tax=Nitrincola iocasae TaxID=2614693 RepID=A0A5J6LHH5_9GAMM|nr:monovalent cation/H+ antiporter complex subunit F [Nitrincola iocasae]QEW07833.1 pH regulation protein F [Nitrincola iocasae]